VTDNFHYSYLNNIPQHFATSLQHFEAHVFNATQTTGRVQRSLGIESDSDEQVIAWRPQAQLHSTECTRVCSVISAYRLLDIVAMLGGASPASSVDRSWFEIPNAFRVSVSAS
jgi:hypothetical protein